MDSTPIKPEIVEMCYLPKLTRNCEELESHPEYHKWESLLTEYFPGVIDLLNEHNGQSSRISSILLLYFQLVSKGSWNTNNKCEECAIKLDRQFVLLYKATCANYLKMKTANNQEVFDKSIEMLHQKLSPEEFKKYPALIEAYCLILNDVKDYSIVLNPASVLPLSLLLIEDYINDNVIKGLRTCLSILKCMTTEHFKEGNYYEVVYRVLKKKIVERDLEVTKLVMECLLGLFQILPSHSKVSITDDALGIILDQMYTETNLYRKKAFFGFINKVIPIHKIHCAKRTMFLTVICDNFDVCTNSAVSEILLTDVLECLENWIKYCWCVWRLQPNKKLMSALVKLLYVFCNDETVADKIQNIFIALCKLSAEGEKKDICSNVEKSLQDNMKSWNEPFAQRLKIIKDCLSST